MTSRKQTFAEDNKFNDYSRIKAIDGRHPLQMAVPESVVYYQVFSRAGGRVEFFNFALAKTMGLLSSDHQESVSSALNDALLDTFAIQIINEFDRSSGKVFKKVKPHPYMAARYLQLQHHCKLGTTSGDGRSIWNGCVKLRGRMWDITSCGTGATSLSPATGASGRFFRTGDPSVSYGCGLATVQEGWVNALYSQILQKQGLQTESCLAVIRFDDGTAINVRASSNLIRPAHLFPYLEQQRLEPLCRFFNYVIDRELTNKRFYLEKTAVKEATHPYLQFAEWFAEQFARSSALMESRLVFCWFDWDGDNILIDGGILDFGSIRQFGLGYYTYRFDDGDRWSTNLHEQRLKARLIVQTMTQAAYFAATGKKQDREQFAEHDIMLFFDRKFEYYRDFYDLTNHGLSPKKAAKLLATENEPARNFIRTSRRIKRKSASKKIQNLPDGKSEQPLFNYPEVVEAAIDAKDGNDFLERCNTKGLAFHLKDYDLNVRERGVFTLVVS